MFNESVIANGSKECYFQISEVIFFNLAIFNSFFFSDTLFPAVQKYHSDLSLHNVIIVKGWKFSPCRNIWNISTLQFHFTCPSAHNSNHLSPISRGNDSYDDIFWKNCLPLFKCKHIECTVQKIINNNFNRNTT